MILSSLIEVAVCAVWCVDASAPTHRTSQPLHAASQPWSRQYELTSGSSWVPGACGGTGSACIQVWDPRKNDFQISNRMKIEPTTPVDDSTLAALLGVSARRIRQLAEAGDLTRTGRNEFHLGQALRELLDHAAGDGANGALMRERVRATKAAADLRELEVAKAKGEVSYVADFERAWSQRCTLIRQNMLNVPTRAVLRLLGSNDEAHFKATLRAEIVSALQAAAAPIDINGEKAEQEERDGE